MVSFSCIHYLVRQQVTDFHENNVSVQCFPQEIYIYLFCFCWGGKASETALTLRDSVNKQSKGPFPACSVVGETPFQSVIPPCSSTSEAELLLMAFVTGNVVTAE